MRAFALIAIAYLLGSIPFGYLIVRLTKGADVRETGSGGTGATNVNRRAGRAAGITTLILDGSKGAVAVLLARWIAPPDFSVSWWLASAALAAVVGHVFPVWLGFRGGKGVATALGAYATVAPLAVAGAAVVCVIVIWKTGYVSLGSIVACLIMPLLVFIGIYMNRDAVGAPILLSTLVAGALIILMHRANIQRLFAGTENRIR